MDKIRADIAAYTPYTELEAAEKQCILNAIDGGEKVFTRDDLAQHITASAIVVNKERTKILFAYHIIYDSWTWLGGHADGVFDLLSVAIREVKEESGVDAKPVTTDIFSMEILPVWAHVKRGKWVPSHLHLNCTYLLEADESIELKNAPEENTGVMWCPIEEYQKYSTEKEMRTTFDKIFRKIKELKY